ncbi:cell agglutination protein Mam3 [Brettanomyces bruxellensis]|uniref:Cell agglutination protein Mam3 n=1 Tax=Dekkera bruxellensis TaxID=5007 RepID=A0A8H6B6Z9_DEKBR|nr:cell agglutination protein Mam3 [Brettanomyces bruxellensis]
MKQYNNTARLPSTAAYSTRMIILALMLPALSAALPLPVSYFLAERDGKASVLKKISVPLTRGEYWAYMISSILLVLLGGVFSGLTLGLMGQDEVHLRVLAQSGSASERRASKTVLNLLARGKHWLLVTLLLSNVVTNETLPVILDRFLGGGAAAVFGSTILIVIFGEIIPQSICVRYGLQIGAFFSNFVLVLMYIMYPVAYPIAKLLDWSLGQDHGTLYGKSGLKTLVNLHHTMGVERLSQDEVTIINAVLDLKDKAVGEVMTPMDKVFSLPSDTTLDEATVERIFNAGFSRIPVHLPDEPTNFVGMLLVRILISYDPEDALPISAFPLATLPETGYYTSCLNILNYFQEGKSHMVVVSDTPGLDTGARGVVTLEDVIEELIGEEIVDESDVYVDVDRNIKRSIPGPLAKRNVVHYLHDLYNSGHDHENNNLDECDNDIVVQRGISEGQGKASVSYSSAENSRENSPEASNYILKKNFNADRKKEKKKASNKSELEPLVRHKVNEVPQPQLQSLGTVITKGIKPSNLAANPLHTNNEHIKIKKQPKLSVPADTLVKLSKSKGNMPLKDKYLRGLRSVSSQKLSNEDRSSSSLAVDQLASKDGVNVLKKKQSRNRAVYDSEVSAFVQGVSENVKRSNDRQNGTGTVKAKRIGKAVCPREGDTHEIQRERGSIASSDSSDGIIESNIVADSGFTRTVIEETAVSDDEDSTSTKENHSSGKRRKSSMWKFAGKNHKSGNE